MFLEESIQFKSLGSVRLMYSAMQQKLTPPHGVMRWAPTAPSPRESEQRRAAQPHGAPSSPAAPLLDTTAPCLLPSCPLGSTLLISFPLPSPSDNVQGQIHPEKSGPLRGDALGKGRERTRAEHPLYSVAGNAGPLRFYRMKAAKIYAS